MHLIEKPIPFGSTYIMKPGMSYRDICVGMRLDESEIEAGILALTLINGPEPEQPGAPAHACGVPASESSTSNAPPEQV